MTQHHPHLAPPPRRRLHLRINMLMLEALALGALALAGALPL